MCCFHQACMKAQPPHQAPAVPPPTLSPTQMPPGASWCLSPPATVPPPLAPCPMASPGPAPFWEKAPWSSALAQTPAQALLLLAPVLAQSLAHCTMVSALATAGANPSPMPTMAPQRPPHQLAPLLRGPSLACPQQRLHQVCCVRLHLLCGCCSSGH